MLSVKGKPVISISLYLDLIYIMEEGYMQH